MSNPLPHKESTGNNPPTASSGTINHHIWHPTSQDPNFIEAAARAEAACRRQAEIDAQTGRTIFAVAHSVGIDGALNPMLGGPTAPEGRLTKGGEPVMRKECSEPMKKRIMDEAREIGELVREAIGKVVHGRRASDGTLSGVGERVGREE